MPHIKTRFHDSMQAISGPLSRERDEKWRRFQDACAGAAIPSFPETFSRTLQDVFLFSDFAAGIGTRRPQIIHDLHESGDIHRTYPENHYKTLLRTRIRTEAADEEMPRLQKVLREIRNREMVRIAYRDLAGMALLPETLRDLSTLADACIEETLTLLYEQLCNASGRPVDKGNDPQKLVVLGLGKLGAMELNFSSDVDLIFAFARSGTTLGGPKPIENAVFFTRLCRRLITALSAATADGFVFRVDTRLRPFGDGGPLCMSFDAMEDYYLRQGREWERYALIKARVAAGDNTTGAMLLERLRPFVYRRYLDYGVFASLREMKRKIAAEMSSKKMKDDIKLGPGGIREIEFFGQIFQLIRGGVLADLQAPGIQTVLTVLADVQAVPREVTEALRAAYRFLRTTENRLQEFADKQTHHLPQNENDRLRLALSMGFDTWAAFERQLSTHRTFVHEQFNMLLEEKTHQPASPADTPRDNWSRTVWRHAEDREKRRRILESKGFDRPDDIIRLLDDLQCDAGTRAMSKSGRERLNRLMPRLLESVCPCDRPSEILGRLMDLIKSIRRRASYLSLLVEYPTVLTQLVKLAGASPWIVTFLSRHPVLLDELIDPRNLYIPPQKEALEAELTRRLEQVPEAEFEYQMEALQIFKQVATLRVAASDITGVLPLMRVSDHLSYIAEVISHQVVALCRDYLVQRHGKPACLLDGEPCDDGFAVVAYGKLGGIELGYGSDLDLVFIHAAAPGRTDHHRRPIDNTYFFSRLGQRFIHTLTVHTAAGRLYEVDMRLRPSGESGILVSHINGFETYQSEKAWTWEHQALIRARVICGDKKLKARFEQIRRNVLARARPAKRLREEVRAMREKLRRFQIKTTAGMFDIKQGVGGIVDIEFLVQYLVLLNAHHHPDILRWTDNVRLLQSLAETGIIDAYTAHFLRHAYLIYRAVVHRLNLQEKKALIAEQRFADLRNGVARVWDACFSQGGKSGAV